MDSPEVCLVPVDIADLPVIQNVDAEVAICNESSDIAKSSRSEENATECTSQLGVDGGEQIKVEIDNSEGKSMQVESGGIPAGSGPVVMEMEGITINQAALGKSEVLPLDNVFHAVNDGYIILSTDATASLGCDSDEPASKKACIQGDSYILTVTDDPNSGSGTQSLKSNNSEPLYLVRSGPRILKKYKYPQPCETTTQISSKPKNSNNAKRTSSDVSQAWFTTKDDKQALHNKGASWKQGQWTKDEVEMLQNNINNYCKEHNINDPTEIIFEMSKDERKDFYRTVAKGLMRPLFSVYRRVTRMYDQKNYMGKYTQEEMTVLKELRKLYGNDWATIGQALGRSASSVKDKCRLMKDTCNSGKWLPEEEKRLCAAVYELTGVKQGEDVTSGLSWANVAEKVATRSEKQCRTKWLNYMNWKQKGGTDWTREDDMNLVLRISSLGVSNDTEIDWNELAENWPSCRSPQWLRGKWWSMKRHYPDYNMLPFNELLEYIKSSHLGNVRIKNQVQVSSEVTLAMPIALQTNADGGSSTDGLQTYEILHQTSSGAYLITQPNSNPAITINGSPVATDHIIVHTLPTSSALSGQESVTIQPSVVLNSETEGLDLDTMEVSLQSSAQDLTDQMITATNITQAEIDSQTEIISTHFENEVITGTGIEGDSDASQSQIVVSSENDGNYKLVRLVTAPNEEAKELMSSLSDPMLPAGDTELIGTSDVEGDKNQGQVMLDISSPDITVSSS